MTSCVQIEGYVDFDTTRSNAGFGLKQSIFKLLQLNEVRNFTPAFFLISAACSKIGLHALQVSTA